MKRTLATVLTAALLVLAGCTGGVPDAPGANGGQDTTNTDSGTVTFYISDERNDIDDFEHLNATVTTVEFHRTNETGDGDGEWVTYELEEPRTVDLTELKGANATEIERFELANGTYNQVRVDVSEVNGTLKSGDETNVKLPSGRIKLNERFTVGNGEEIDFVFDITVVKAGNSGKYILKPVASESGTDVPIQSVDSDEDGIGARFVGQVTPGEDATVLVTGENGPAEGATVTVGDETYTTDADGRVTFAVPEDAEELEVEIEHEDREAGLEAEFGERADEAEREDSADDADEGDEREDDGEDDGMTTTQDPGESPNTGDDGTTTTTAA